MMRIIRSWPPGGQVVLTAYLICDGCGRPGGPPMNRFEPQGLSAALVRLRTRARTVWGWGRKVLFEYETGDPIDGDLCRECLAARAGRRPWN